MADFFKDYREELNGPYSNAEDVAPNDSVDLPDVTRGIHAGTGGDISVIMRGGQSVVFEGLSPGQVVPIRVTRVLATSTTATKILALW